MADLAAGVHAFVQDKPTLWYERDWAELQPAFAGHPDWFGGGWGKMDENMDIGVVILLSNFRSSRSILASSSLSFNS